MSFGGEESRGAAEAYAGTIFDEAMDQEALAESASIPKRKRQADSEILAVPCDIISVTLPQAAPIVVSMKLVRFCPHRFVTNQGPGPKIGPRGS